MTPQEFIAKWKRSKLSERSGSHEHFLDLCALFSHPTPAGADPDGAEYTFERGVTKTGGGKGWADVWKRYFFAWEYKGKHKDLDDAYKQLLRYREDLENPPLLVVCDMDRFVVHTNFTNSVKTEYAFNLDQLAEPKYFEILRKVFTDPARLEPKITPKDITEEVAKRFATLADEDILSNQFKLNLRWVTRSHTFYRIPTTECWRRPSFFGTPQPKATADVSGDIHS